MTDLTGAVLRWSAATQSSLAVEPVPEIVLHLPHEVADDGLQVAELGAVLGGDEEAELVAIAGAAFDERLAVGIVGRRTIKAARFIFAGDAVGLDPSDEYVFKVPTLRNIALTAPYFHTGKAWDLRQAVAVMGTSQLGTQLTDDEINKITTFLDSLTGEQPKVTYPILPPSVVSTPRPQP